MTPPPLPSPAITVVTPVRNARAYIAGCIENVRAQGFDSYEHIVMDAMSDDGTSEVVAAAAAGDPRIVHVRAPDGGQSDAMNKAIARARGPVLTFLNADDFFEPDVLPFVAERFRSLPPDSMLVGDCHQRNADDEITRTTRPTCFDAAKLVCGAKYFQHPVNPSSYFYHRSLHDRCGLYRTDEHYALDVDFLLRAFQVANVVKVDRVLGNFRFIPGTKSHHAFASGIAKWQILRVSLRAVAGMRFADQLRAIYWLGRTRGIDLILQR